MAKFCTNCGNAKPDNMKAKCSKCGYEPDMNVPLPKFCPECGTPMNS